MDSQHDLATTYGELPGDRLVTPLRERLEAIRLRACGAASWLEPSRHYARLINRDGVVPVTARFTADDLTFLALAREELRGFAELGVRLIGLHQPMQDDRIADTPDNPMLRCRNCMWRWPCPTFGIIAEVVEQLEHPA